VRRATTTAAFVGLLGLLAPPGLSGCGDAAPLGPEVRCRSHGDCDPSQTCSFGYCISDGVNTRRYHIRLRPTAEAGLVEQQLPDLALADGPAVDITLVAPVAFVGVVQRQGRATNEPGILEARTEGDVPGLDLRFTAKSTQGLNEDGYGYRLLLLPGRSYVVTFRPDDKAVPAHTFDVAAADVHDRVYDIALPSDAYAKVAGFVRFGPLEPIAGARVTAILADGRVSTSTTTEPTRGHFALDLPPGTQSVGLKIQAPEGGPLFPDYKTELLELADNLDIWVPPATQYKPITAEIVVIGLDAYGQPQPVTETKITLAHREGTLVRSGATDSDGRARIETLDGEQDVLISPPPTSEWQAALVVVDLVDPAKAPAPVIELPRRVTLRGTVGDPGGTPVAEGTVEATYRLAPEDTNATLVKRPGPFTAPIVDGAFELRVDDGRYDLRVTPAQRTGAPPAVRCDVASDAGQVDFTLTPPGLAHLRVLGPSGDAVPNVTVEMFEATPSAGCAPPSLLTRGTTDGAGVVNLLVPFAP
jgi:hypothetical protein